jgi:hypothetical protein
MHLICGFREVGKHRSFMRFRRRCIEIIADEFFVHNVLNLDFQDSEPANKFRLSRH